MGLFLALSGVVGCTGTEVAAALTEFAGKYSGHMRRATANEDDATRLVIAPGPAGATILYPSGFLEWDKASEFLSLRLQKPAFSFHIHDGDLWMFHLYVEGRVAAAFNPIPDYWGDISEEEERLMRGDVSVITQCVPGLKASAVERYLVRWDLDAESPGKAYPDDEFSIGEDWQLTDFMKKLGFVYPLDQKGAPMGECFGFRVDLPKNT